MVVLAVLVVAAPHEVPLGTVLYGVFYGSLNGLLALGLVLLFRVTRVINFAYGAMGGVAAGIGASIYLAHGWPWAGAVALALVVGGGVGLGVGALVNWRFSRSSSLVLTVASIGLAQLLGGIALYVPRWFHGPALIASFPTGLSKLHFEINPVLFDGNDIVVAAAVPLVVLVVSWFLLGTDAGRAVRAIADNRDRARLVGIPARRLLLLVWTVGGVVAALAVMLAAPSQGVPLDAAAGPQILLAPLAAFVIAGMESLTIAFAAGVGLGVLEAVVRLNISEQAVYEPIFLGVILVALLAHRRSESRAAAGADAGWSASGVVRPLARGLRSLPEVRVARLAGVVVLAGLLVAVPVTLTPARIDEVSVGLVFAMAALSLVVLTGWAGTVSLGQMAVVGVGAVVAGDLMMHMNLDLFWSLVAGGVGGGAIAILLGLPALRVNGLYLAVVTMAFAVAANDYFFNPTNFARALPSSILRPVLFKRFSLQDESDLYWLCLTVLVLLIALTLGVRKGRAGRAIVATRDNLRAAEASALATVRIRLMAFTIAGVIAGVAGGLYAVILKGVGYQTFQPVDSITVFAMVVIGGTSSIGGTLAGVALIQWLGIAFPNLQILLSGVGLLVVLMVFPSGLAGLYGRLRDVVMLRVARRRGLDTSAWADESVSVSPAPTLPVPSVGIGNGHPHRDGLLTCAKVDASYGPMQVLFGVDLDVREGEILALLGTNGAGKSSLLRAITDLLPASSGEVMFAGRPITHTATEDIVALGIGMMPGGRGLFPTLTVGENLRVALWPLRKDRAKAQVALDDALTRFPILEERRQQLAGDLSGGEQQMLSLAMAFLVKPRLLLIDELSLGLAPTVVATLIEAVRGMHRQGATIVVVEQSVSVALLVAERAVFLERGQVRFTGATSELLDRPDLLRSVFIEGADSSASGVQRPGDGRVSTPTRRPPADAAPPTPTLVCRQVVKSFGGLRAVDGVDLAVHRGEVVGLIGHNGAGKTTLLDVISGFLEPDGGQIWIDDEEISLFPPHERALCGLGRSFQEARLFPSLTVVETIAVALDRHVVSRDPVAAAFRMPASTDSEASVLERVEEIVAGMGLGAFRHRPTLELSTGTRRIVELACMVAQRPSLILLDEPSGGIAQAETQALGPLLRSIVDDTHCAMVVIEHDMGLVSELCDRLVALELGRVIADGTPDDVLSHPDVIASYLGTDQPVMARSGGH
jgi:ABC-type branched-subunit amino acid transport system ATPase component/ABC-type branched-subunit amino acid transport system permease subunit